MGSYQVSTPSFEAETADGKRRLTTVIARQVGQPGPGLVVVAHRDALGRGARAELSGTAAMLELAPRGARRAPEAHGDLRLDQRRQRRARGRARPRPSASPAAPARSSCSATSRGRRCAGRSSTGWSTGDGVGSLQLRRTVEAAVRKEAGTNPGGARATSQWARLAFPVTVGEQGPLVADDLPAALMSVSGERPPPAGDPIVRPVPDAGLRARRPAHAHRARQHADPASSAARRAPSSRCARCCPCGPCGCSSPPCCWPRCSSPSTASRACAAATSRSARGCGGSSPRRRRSPSRWPSPGSSASPACCRPRRRSPWRRGRYRSGPPGTVALVAVAARRAAGLDRPAPGAHAQGRHAPGPVPRRGRGRRPARHLVRGGRRAVAAQPLRGGPARPGRARPARRHRPRRAPAARPGRRPRRGRGRARSCSSTCRSPGQLGLSPPDFGWFCVLLVAGGVVGPLGWVIWSLVLTCLVAALLMALRSRSSVTPPRDAADHRPRPRQLRGPGLARRHRVRAAAMRRALGTALVVAGLLVLADAAATLAWQEPFSALRAASRPAPPRRAAARARARRTPRHAADRRPRWPSTRARAGALAPRRPGGGRAAHRAHRPATPSSCAGPRPPTCARARASSPARRCPASTARRPSPGTAPPTARPFRHLDALRRGDAITVRLPYAHLPLRGRRPADRPARGPFGVAPGRP